MMVVVVLVVIYVSVLIIFLFSSDSFIYCSSLCVLLFVLRRENDMRFDMKCICYFDMMPSVL